MRNKLRRFLRLSWRDRLLFARLMLLMPVMSLALRLIGYKRVYTALGSIMRHPTPISGGSALTEAKSVGQVVRFAANTTQTTCLPRSLTLWWLLARRGVEAALRIGVRVEQGVFTAHAWVEVQGRVISDRADVRSLYAPFAADIADQRQLRMR